MDFSTINEQIAALAVTIGILGFLINPVVSYLKLALGLNVVGRSNLKIAVAIITSFIFGVVTVAFNSQLFYNTFQGILYSTALVFSAATVIYNIYWKDSEAITKIEGVY